MRIISLDLDQVLVWTTIHYGLPRTHRKPVPLFHDVPKDAVAFEMDESLDYSGEKPTHWNWCSTVVRHGVEDWLALLRGRCDRLRLTTSCHPSIYVPLLKATGLGRLFDEVHCTRFGKDQHRLPYPAPGLRLAHVDDQDVFLGKVHVQSAYADKAPLYRGRGGPIDADRPFPHERCSMVDITRHWVCSTLHIPVGGEPPPLRERHRFLPSEGHYRTGLPEWHASELKNDPVAIAEIPFDPQNEMPSLEELTRRIDLCLEVPYEEAEELKHAFPPSKGGPWG